MKLRILNRMAGVFLIAAVSLLGTGGLGNAQQENRNMRHQPQQVEQRKGKNTQLSQKRRQPAPETARVARKQQPPRQTRLPKERQLQLIEQEKTRSTHYRDHLRNQEVIARDRTVTLRQQKRFAHDRYQQQYYERLRLQRRQIENTRAYNYNRDPYYYTAPRYRYSHGGSYYETNQYGANLLRQAVNYGYQQGYRAGQADRQDRWNNGYEDSYAYQDANYGFYGRYVDQSTYNHYFREGFRRGYEDGYNRHNQYGRVSKGTFVILASVLAGILILEAIDD